MSIYHTEYRHVARAAFSMWNRDPASPSFGSFDRQWWGWKFKDFGDATLQYGVRLALPYAEELGASNILPDLVAGWIAHCQRIQSRDGSFDQCYPHERTPGVIYDVLSTLVTVRQSRWIDDKGRASLDDIMRRAVAFALKTDEKHGEVGNHIAEFAYELLNYSAFSGDDAARRRGQQYIDRLLSLFNREEGWFNEYHGPDCGYQTRALRYVAKCAQLTSDNDIWEVAERGGAFVAELMMPDGSVHPMLGVRSTALVYPSAFELLARRNGRFRDAADRIRFAWEQRRVPLPSVIDFQNGIRLADDARDAAELARDREPVLSPPPLPPTDGWKFFTHAGLAVRRSGSLAVYVAVRLGGAVVVYEDTDLAYEDAGYLLRGDKVSVSRMPNAGELTFAGVDTLKIRARFHESLHDELTPLRMIALRVLNLTVLRWQWVGDLFRKLVVSRLMADPRPLDVTLEREVRTAGSQLVIDDRVTSAVARPGELFRCRRITGLHMASSRYFQADELKSLPLEWTRRIEWNGTDAVSTVEVPLRSASQGRA